MHIPFFGRAKRAAEPAAALGEAPAPKKRQWARSLASIFKSGEASANDSWTTTLLTPDDYISRFHQTLVARSRHQWANNDYVRAFIRLVRQNIVGPQGVTMQARSLKARGGLDKEANAAIEAAWEDWCIKGNCDVTGDLSWREIQCLVTETTARDGEFFARIVYGKEAGPHEFAVQLIDSARIPTWYSNQHFGQGGNFIRHGIEFNRYGRPVAYHFSSTDEGDASYYSNGGQGFARVPAADVIHGFVHELIAQRRGLPWASTSLDRLHHLQGFTDASVQNARASATKMGFIQYKEGYGPEADEDANVADGIDAEPLSMHELPQGAEFVKFDPTYPSGEFAVFNKAQLRGAASGMGVPYNDLANDLEGVNFSSIRQATLDAREHYKERQQWLIETLIQPVHRAWMRWKLLRGDIKVKGMPLDASKLTAYSAVNWQPRRWQWIDPRADVQSAIDAIRAGLTSMSQVIREQGRDPETVYAELAEDLKAMKAAGIPDDVITSFILGVPPPPPPEPEVKEKAEP